MATALPNPWTTCRFEQEANEPEPVCAYCEACEVSNPGDYCSMECEAFDLADANDDRGTVEQLMGAKS